MANSCEEALNNVHKHAGVADVEVTLVLNSAMAVLRVSDKGRGITKKQRLESASTSIGLSSMKERTEALRRRSNYDHKQIPKRDDD